MKIANCVIVDDEPIARNILETYCSHLPALKVVAVCSNALEAKVALQQQEVDIVFLDINMPVLTGIAFLKTLKNPPQIIFTTAYKEYAVDAFDLSAIDYLLKPFSLERFIVAVDKALERINQPAGIVQVKEGSRTTQQQDHLFIKADGKIFKVFYNDLLFAEANGNYTKVVTIQNTLLPSMTFSSFEELLPKQTFIRVHRSFIINKSKITHIEGNQAYIGKVAIALGSNYKEAFLKLLGV